ncbi:MAG: transcription-repair coupling factor [Lachnospiraceae bacterium]|nr:transcription-repair coupling factor [Lachnospiraceae bacterium]
MQTFLQPLTELGEYESARRLLERETGTVQVAGCLDSQKAHMIYGLGQGKKYRLILASNELKAKEIYEDYRFFDPKVLLYPAKDLIFFSADVHGNYLVKQRMNVIRSLLSGEPLTVVTSVDGCMDHVLPLEVMREYTFRVTLTSIIGMDTLKSRLVSMGYERCAQVEEAGQFAVRGGIVDIFPLTEENPFRIEFWGDEVDSIRSFDVMSQRSIENLNEVTLYPASELLLTRPLLKKGLKAIEAEEKKQRALFEKEGKTEEAGRLKRQIAEWKERLEYLDTASGADGFIDYFYDRTVSFLEYFPEEETVVFLDEPGRVEEKSGAVEAEFRESMLSRLEKGYLLPGQLNLLYGYKDVVMRLNRFHCAALSMMEARGRDFRITGSFHLDVKSVTSFNGSFELLTEELRSWKKKGYRTVLFCASRTRAKRLAEELRDFGLNSFYSEDRDRIVQKGEILVLNGSLKRGYEYPLIRFGVISESDIFGKEQKKKRKRRVYEGQHIQSFSELSVGDYVVHENHGLGIYRGIEKVEVDHTVKDYIKIEYADGGNLYILATQLDALQKYAGADSKKPKLNRLGGQDWNRTKTRVRGAVQEVAKDLVELYAARQAREGFVYGPDTVWQKEFEEMFPFEETEDQLLAIEATKKDMESSKIMDRLVCGDVGYGKTEIAIRAAFKAVQEGKQVAYLVPTTILAQQHYNTFVQRMKDYPVRVDLLCRFRTASEQKKTVEDLKKGQVDIVIGTHRLLSRDVEYKDLGLLVIDEEQRFGVTHKEKIKKLKENVDVLTLTATPIPRTLHMSLIGIRDMSVLEEAPVDRMPIQTFVMEYNDEMVREAICRELARGGQVFYVYNRVNTIIETANRVAKLVPEANVAFAHGQMKEQELEKIMYDFINGDVDVLVSTTIIETGLDISNVNTMIIEDADQLGLSQLYQLRGRVGRSSRTAYAFLMYKRDKMLKEVAEKRLHAIREFTELGSGFKIAMRDLEIRGAGNLLGAQQHGHMEAVGYDLYCKMLNEAVKSLKGLPVKEDFETTIDVEIDAYIPDKYIRNEFQKLDIYKRIAQIENEEEYEDMLEELMDRFGEPPKSVQNLLEIANVKALAHSADVAEVSQKPESIRFTMYEKARVNPAKIPELINAYGGMLKFTVDAKPYFLYQPPKNSRKEKEEPLAVVKNVLNGIKSLIDE